MNYKRKWIITGALLVILIFVRIPVMENFYERRSEKQLLSLNPEVRLKARKFLQKAREKGIILVVADGYRSAEQQEALYALGRTSPGRIVTFARAGQSKHNYGRAIDVYPVVFGFVHVFNEDWDDIAAIGKSLGFKWGGDWKSYKDRPHFEY